ncbi:hypothetical protein NAS2_1119 [Conexivisphaera calida]|uniref:Uncharacterized protein n=1 Tax=Conexivisphaera calida TaxID=1874277 RepID=A0A4P2VNI8_9ARCH|nr:hypothetical protein NAS2_1119 [Conexivisphaera calida]
MATADGRAFYVFVSLLKELGVPFSAHLPWEQFQASLVLTTRREMSPRGNVLYYEELTGDRVIDSAMILSSTSRGRDELLIGVDPGHRIGVVVHYRGVLVHEGVYRDPGDVASLLRRLLALSAKVRIIRLGFGNPEMARAIIHESRDILGGEYVLELVDERNTTGGGMRLRRDVEAALRISRRRGRFAEP